jgi:hypothetical protein
MEQIYIAHWESRNYIYQGFGHTAEEAKKVCLKGYRTMIKRCSGDTLTKHEIEVFNDEVSIEELKMGKCLVDCGRQGWL